MGDLNHIIYEYTVRAINSFKIPGELDNRSKFDIYKEIKEWMIRPMIKSQVHNNQFDIERSYECILEYVNEIFTKRRAEYTKVDLSNIILDFYNPSIGYKNIKLKDLTPWKRDKINYN